MAQVTGPIVINNGAATPVAKSFSPEQVSPAVATFTERTASMSAGFARLTLNYSPASSKRATNRVDVSLDLPVVVSDAGVSKVQSVGRFKGYFVIPDTFAATDRADLHAYVANALDNALIKALVKDLDPMY